MVQVTIGVADNLFVNSFAQVLRGFLVCARQSQRKVVSLRDPYFFIAIVSILSARDPRVSTYQ